MQATKTKRKTKVQRAEEKVRKAVKIFEEDFQTALTEQRTFRGGGKYTAEFEAAATSLEAVQIVVDLTERVGSAVITVEYEFKAPSFFHVRKGKLEEVDFETAKLIA